MRPASGRSWALRLGVLLAALVVVLTSAQAAPASSARDSSLTATASLPALPGISASASALTAAASATTSPAPAPVRLADGAVAARVAVGFRHTCALTRTGGVQCWGDNTYGQLGRSTTGAPSPTASWVTGLRSGVASLSAGEDHTCVVTTTGAARCWGSNTWGMLGDGTTTDRSAPVTPSGLGSGMRSVSAGAQQTCAQRTSGAVACWGWNGSGGLGDGTTADRLAPVTVQGLPADVTSVATGATYACALTGGGRLWCWGGSRWLAGAGEYFALTTPRLVSLTEVKSIQARLDRTCAVTAAGSTWCWGGPGELGDGRNYNPDAPVPARVETLGDGSTAAVAPGQVSTCVLTPAGAVRCWGLSDTSLDDLVQGNSRTLGAWRPAPVTGLSSGVVQVENNYNHRCVLTSSGEVRCWGRNVEGQLGRGTLTGAATAAYGAPTAAQGTSIVDRGTSASPRPAPSQWRSTATEFVDAVERGSRLEPAADAADAAGTQRQGTSTGSQSAATSTLPPTAEVAAGESHACARTTGGRLWCWGSNFYGETAAPVGSPNEIAREVPGLSGVTDVGLGGHTSCAVASSRVWCWGDNFHHEISPSDDVSVPTPTRVDALTSSTRAVSTALGHTCALSVTGGVACWGSNFNGGLGTGSTGDASTTPVTPQGLGAGVAALSDGRPECVVMTGGQVRCWSFASPSRTSPTPVVVPLPAAAKAVTVGAAACALLTTGAVYCWGDNQFGFLGDGTVAPRTGPRLVRGLGSGVVALSSAYGVTCAVLGSGSTRCWGGSSGGLGNLSTYASSVPVATGSTGAPVRQVATGGGFACVVDARPSVWCWGDSLYGQLGIPNDVPKPYSRLPVRVG